MSVKKLSVLIQGRVASGLELESYQLTLQLADGSALVMKRTVRGVSAILHEVAAANAASSKDQPTVRQRVMCL